MPTALAPQAEGVHVFDVEPDLLAAVDAPTAEVLRRRVVVPRLWVEPGPWSPPGDEAAALGLLIVEGLMTRSLELDGRRCPELVGAGDLLRPWDEQEGSVVGGASWVALEPTSLAVLDERFAAVVSRCPSIVDDLLSRTLHRSRALALQLAIAQVRHADARLELLLWHLAERWGRVTPAGVHLPLRLTHAMLAQLASMQRPTASTAVTQLMRAGRLARRPDGTWLLTGGPPSARERRPAR